MKVVILAGGVGSRISEETTVIPKPLIQIGGKPILWHIMKIYAAHGLTDFIICCGYKGHLIKQYFCDHLVEDADFTVDFTRNTRTIHKSWAEPWRVTVVDTGENTETAGRVRRVRSLIGDETFCLTYGDGVSDVDITETIRFHREHGRQATLTAVQPPHRFGVIRLEGDDVSVRKAAPTTNTWVNGGFFVLEPEAIDSIDGDATPMNEPLDRIAIKGELRAFRHQGFWHPMDTLRDKEALEALWNSGQAPWKIWDGQKELAVHEPSTLQMDRSGRALSATVKAKSTG